MRVSGVERVGEGIGDGGWGRCSAAAAAWRLLGAAMRCFMRCPKGQRRRATPAPPSLATLVTETDAVGHATGSVEEVEGRGPW